MPAEFDNSWPDMVPIIRANEISPSTLLNLTDGQVYRISEPPFGNRDELPFTQVLMLPAEVLS